MIRTLTLSLIASTLIGCTNKGYVPDDHDRIFQLRTDWAAASWNNDKPEQKRLGVEIESIKARHRNDVSN